MPLPKIAVTIGSWFTRHKLLTGSTIIILVVSLLFSSGYIYIQHLQSEIQNQNQAIQSLSSDINRQNEAIRSLAERQEMELKKSRERVERELRRQESVKEERKTINSAEDLNEWLSNL